MDNKTALLVLMVVLIAFIVLLSVLGIVFIIALRRRRPIVKVVMAPTSTQDDLEEEAARAAAAAPVPAPAPVPVPIPEVAEEPVVEEVVEEPVVEEEPAPEVEDETPVVVAPVSDDDEEEEVTEFVTEGDGTVRYDRSFTAKVHKMNNESRGWYSELKNDLLSYNKVKSRMSWKRETFRMGRLAIARFVVRGKTLCLLLAVEPIGYAGTKYNVEDVSNVASTVDTPTLYRIKSERRFKYAKEMIAGMMEELKTAQKENYEPEDFYLPYEDDMTLIKRGLIKLIGSGSTVASFPAELFADKKDEQATAEAVDEAPAEEIVEETPVEEIAEEPVPEEKEPVEEVVQEPASVEEAPVEEVVEETAPVEEVAPAADASPAGNYSEEDDGEEESTTYVTEGHEIVRYERSFTAKVSHMNNESKEWYSALKNELLSYAKVKDRMSWKRETFRIGRMAVARLTVRGKTLCLLLAVEPDGYIGTKFNVEDVSKVASTMDTPTMYRIRSARRLKYAKELIEGMMSVLHIAKNPQFVEHDYYIPYAGDMSLMKRGLVKRVVTGTTRTFKIEEVNSKSDAKGTADKTDPTDSEDK